MVHKYGEPPKTLALPVLAYSPADIGRLLREVENIDSYLLQQELRKDSHIKMPPTGHLMDQLLELNKLDLIEASQRKLLQDFLQATRQAPVIHMSFSADPDTAFIGRLMEWLRSEIHPQILLTVGLQPNIGAGCIVRTTNKHFDFSLRQNFASKRELLLSKLAESTRAATPQGAAK